MKVLVLGCAGFIGSNLTDRLVNDGYEVLGIDNLSTGHIEFVNPNIKFVLTDLFKDTKTLNKTMKDFKPNIVFHLSANADIKDGAKHPKKDLEQNTIVTYNVLDAMRKAKVNKIMFASTGSVYGEANKTPTPEKAWFPTQTSLYSASKLACEGMIQGFCETFDMYSWIFRFVSILGDRYTHGHVFDFTKKLLKDPTKLDVLGNGYAEKSYLHVNDCIDGILTGIKSYHPLSRILNLGTDETMTVKESISYITSTMNVYPELQFENQISGWRGDISYIRLDCTNAKYLGWKPKYTIKESVELTTKYLLNNQWLFKDK